MRVLNQNLDRRINQYFVVINSRLTRRPTFTCMTEQHEFKLGCDRCPFADLGIDAAEGMRTSSGTHTRRSPPLIINLATRLFQQDPVTSLL